MIPATFQDYVPLGDLARIVAVCVGVAVIAPSAAALVITGLEAQASGASRLRGDIRIALGVAAIVALVAIGILALINR